MIFIETTIFTKLLPKYLTDDEYRALQWYLVFYPEAGVVVPGSGGVRKVRWAPEGKGKRGGIRIMYYWKKPAKEIWLLPLYSKSEKATIPGHILKMIAEEIKNE
jgi:mRNA-degrading endonuclease RelE of RelBE toxin-antitoxin system